MALGSCHRRGAPAELETPAAGALGNAAPRAWLSPGLGTSHRVPSSGGMSETVDTLNNAKVSPAKAIPHPVLGQECNPKQGFKT